MQLGAYLFTHIHGFILSFCNIFVFFEGTNLKVTCFPYMWYTFDLSISNQKEIANFYKKKML